VQNLIMKNCLIFSISFLCCLLINTAFAHDTGLHAKSAQRRPLGDGKVTATAKQGYVMACRTQFPGGGGAHRVGEWIDVAGGTWDPTGKPQVEGAVNWPNASISVSVEGNERVVRANNLPTHPSGQFPIRSGSAAHAYDRNPNSIRDQTVLLRLPAQPKVAEQPGCVPLGMIGFALSGVAIFNAFDVQGRDAPAYEIQDSCNGHPERNGQYHYHDWSPCLAKDTSGKAYAHDEPVGWMLDGFPILGPYDAAGKTFTNSQLDECHGTTGNVRINGQVTQMYHYRFTLEYPYTVGCFRGARVR
jgi:YHYH protein